MTQTVDVDGAAVNASVYTAAAVTDNSLADPVVIQISVDLSSTADVSNMTVMINGTRLDGNQTQTLLSLGNITLVIIILLRSDLTRTKPFSLSKYLELWLFI